MMPVEQILTPEEINKCHQIFNNPLLFSQQEILAKALRIRKILCLPIQQKYEQEINVIMNSNLHVSIYKYMTSLIQRIKEELKNILNAPHKNQSSNQEVLILGQCLWIFTNLCLGDSETVNKIVSLGILRVTEQTLTMLTYPSIVECTLQLIGNLLGQKNDQIKLYYLKSLTFAHFLKESFIHIWFYKSGCDQHITWALANAFRELYKMIPQDDPLIQHLLQFYLPILATYLQYPKSNENTDMNIYWTLTYMTVEWDYYYTQISMLINQRFQNSNPKIKKMMVQIYGNMVANSQVGVKLVIQHELILPFILNSLKNKNPDKSQEKFMKTCGWVLSNILAGTEQQIDFLLNNYSTFFNEIYEILEINTKYSIIKQLTWAICNMLQCCSMEAFQMLYSSNILVILAQKVSLILQEYNDQRLAEVYVEGIENYISKHSQFPQKFTLQISQKVEILKTLSEVRNYFNMEAKTIRVSNAIAYLESILAVEEIAMIHIK